MHEVFLQRLASHSVFRLDSNLKVFLEYDQDLCAKPRKKMDLFGGLVSILFIKTINDHLINLSGNF